MSHFGSIMICLWQVSLVFYDQHIWLLVRCCLWSLRSYFGFEIQGPFGLLTSFSVPLWSISVSFLVHVIVCGLLWSWGRLDPLSFISFIYFKFIFIVKIIIVATHIWYSLYRYITSWSTWQVRSGHWFGLQADSGTLYRLYFLRFALQEFDYYSPRGWILSLGGVEKYICYDMSCKSFFDFVTTVQGSFFWKLEFPVHLWKYCQIWS